MRVLRAYKVKLVHAYCQSVLNEVYFDSTKIHALRNAKELRKIANYFEVGDCGENQAPFLVE